MSTKNMPILFLGHGNPMNAIEENEFVDGFRNIAETIPQPASILCISAHWETSGTLVTAMEKPRTIHDFGGFPEELYHVRYDAPGNPMLARTIQSLITGTAVGLDETWGLDHGTWSVVKLLYPEADVPVVQLSLSVNLSPQQHYDLAKTLSPLRKQGVLIIGSGNMVHNLGMVDWRRLNEIGYAYDWVLEAQNKMNDWITKNDHARLINYQAQGKAFEYAIPTPEHFLPLLYILALKEDYDRVSFFNDKAVAGSLSMTSVKIDGLL